MSDNQADNRSVLLRKERRLGIVPVSIEVMAQHLITPKLGIKVMGLPIDALFITAYYAPERYGLMMVYGHESFEKVPEGVELPLLDVVYRQYQGSDLGLEDIDGKKKRVKSAHKSPPSKKTVEAEPNDEQDN